MCHENNGVNVKEIFREFKNRILGTFSGIIGSSLAQRRSCMHHHRSREPRILEPFVTSL